jgi:hypothetical protein
VPSLEAVTVQFREAVTVYTDGYSLVFIQQYHNKGTIISLNIQATEYVHLSYEICSVCEAVQVTQIT